MIVLIMEKWLQVLVIVKIAPTRYFVQLSIHPRLHNVPCLGLSFLATKKKKKKKSYRTELYSIAIYIVSFAEIIFIR